jgi:hypothetical protein
MPSENMTDEKLAVVREMFNRLDKRDVHFMEATVVMLMDTLLKGNGAIFIFSVGSENSNMCEVSMASCNLATEEVYEIMSATTASMMEDLATAPSTTTPQ